MFLLESYYSVVLASPQQCGFQASDKLLSTFKAAQVHRYYGTTPTWSIS
jgi:hypothetical protein